MNRKRSKLLEWVVLIVKSMIGNMVGVVGMGLFCQTKPLKTMLNVTATRKNRNNLLFSPKYI